jgi:fructose/tagatose bisphosphate aldolase
MLCDPIQSRRLFEHALDNNYAILAANADSHAAVTDCLNAAKLCDAPLIIETSLWQLEGHSYGAGDAIRGLSRYIADLAVLADSPEYRSIPVVLHTDHIKGPETMEILGAAIRGIPVTITGNSATLRASTVSLDASEFSDEENIEAISRLAAMAVESNVDVTLEMESAVDEGITPEEVTRNLIGSVEEKYPNAVCLYAPGLGTRHGFSAEGYPEFNSETVQRNIRLLKKITGRDIGLALHGSSGLSSGDLRDAAQAGVVKVNWSTESLMIRSRGAMAFYEDNAAKLDRAHSEWKVTAMDNGVQSHISPAYIDKVSERMRIINSEGKASDFAQTPMA